MSNENQPGNPDTNNQNQVPPLLNTGPSLGDLQAMITGTQPTVGDLGEIATPQLSIPSSAPVYYTVPVIFTEHEPAVEMQIEPEPPVTITTPTPVVSAQPMEPDPISFNTETASNETGITTESGFKPIRYTANNALQEYPASIPLTDKEKNLDAMVALPSDTQENTHRYISGMSSDDIETTVSGVRWMDLIRASRYTTPYYQAYDGINEEGEKERPNYSNHEDAWFKRTIERDGAMWKQTISGEKGGKLAAASPSFNDKPVTNLTGNAAILRVRHLVGLGSIIQIPLWHSGFWLTLKAPPEGAFLELSRRLSEDKITLGRATYGLAFANTSSFFASQIMSFALSNVDGSTLKSDITPAEMRSMISSLDIPLIAWGLACVEWPQGFLYARSILGQEEDPNAVIRERLNVRKLTWTDNSALTPWQISHMANRHGNAMTRESITRYKDEFTRGKGRDVELAPDLIMTLRVPTMDQYLTSGTKWVNNIENMVNQAFGQAQDPVIRDQYIIDQGKATNMRQFSHMVDCLTVQGNRVVDTETIENTFDSLSSSDDVREKYFAGIRAFVEDATMSIVAIPISDANDKAELPRFPHLLPLDVLSVFFTLLVQKTQQIRDRG